MPRLGAKRSTHAGSPIQQPSEGPAGLYHRRSEHTQGPGHEITCPKPLLTAGRAESGP